MTPPRQTITGNGNIQAGGDVHLHPQPPATPPLAGSPHARACPQCGALTGRFSDRCAACDYAVRAHFDDLQAKAARDSRQLWTWSLAAAAMLAMAAYLWLNGSHMLALAPFAAAVGMALWAWPYRS